MVLSHMCVIGRQASPATLLKTVLMGEDESTALPVTNLRKVRAFSTKKVTDKIPQVAIYTLSSAGFIKLSSSIRSKTQPGVADRLLYKE